VGYDYIVVGAGSAGCVVARRLVDAGAEVLVLEAGEADEQREIHVPAAVPALFRSSLDWNYETVPQKFLNSRSDYWPRGKTLGGTSSINAQIYQRGAPSDYDGWVRLGNDGWSWSDVLPVFKRSENQERGPSEYHGVGGPLNVADLRDPNPLSKAFVEAAQEQGLPLNNDFNGEVQEGFGLYQVTQKGGFRWSSARAFLHPAMKKNNCTVITGAHVTRLTIKDGRCMGVTFLRDRAERTVEACTEVILSGGAINSPQVLMLSGIGHAAQLEKVGIKVVHQLPGVGQNLQDHMMSPVAYRATKEVSLASASNEEEEARFENEQMGLLTSNIAEAGGFMTVNDSPAPDLQFHFVPGWNMRHGDHDASGHGYTLSPTLVATHSIGSMWLASNNPLDKPALDPAYLEDDRDLEILLEGTKIARQILGSSAFDEFRGEEFAPGAATQADDDLREHIRNYATTIYHPVGTCKMGHDDLAVVDDQLCVHGIDNLRVADASIMPKIVNANTNAPSIMIGEKCSAMLLADS